ncbi:MAG: TetR/AcrR family transcriptional regulator [Phycisphaerae bacterium]
MREKILDVAEHMTQDRGLEAVTFQELADAVGLRKPSVFHHIKNKDELALALIDRCGTKHGPHYRAAVAQDTPAPDKLHRIAEIFAEGLRNKRPCLIAALSAGRNTLSEHAQEQLRERAQATIQLFASVFEQGRSEGTLAFAGEPEQASTGFFAMLQGLQTLSRTIEDSHAFENAAKAYIDSITATT